MYVIYVMRKQTITSFAVAFAVVVALGGGVALAQDSSPAWGSALYEDMGTMSDQYNANVDGVEFGIVGDQLDERYVNLYVSGPGGTAAYSFYLDGNLHMSDLNQGANPNADVKMTTDKRTVDRIVASDNPAAAFRTAVENDEVVIAGEDGNVLQQLKWGILNLLKGLLS